MARATRSTTADLKRKRPADSTDSADTAERAPTKLARTDDGSDDAPEPLNETSIDGHGILSVLETEDKQGLLERVFPLPDSASQASLRSLLSASSPVSFLKAAIDHLRPISSHPRSRLSETAAQQVAFCDLASFLLDQTVQATDHLQSTSIHEPSSPQRPKPSYALVQHLPSGDWWSSLLPSSASTSNLQTGNAELVAIFPTPSSSSSDKHPSTLGSYCPKQTSQKRQALPHRRVRTGAFLDYGLYSSFAPSFDMDGEDVGRRELGEVIWYKEEKKHLRELQRRERLEGRGSIVDVPEDEPEITSQEEPIPDLELEALLPPEDVESIKLALNSLELEKSVQQLLERNQRALRRLEELQKQRLTKHPTSNAEEGSEEWETAQAILDSLTALSSLRPRSSTEERPGIIPPPTVLHKLHRTLALEPSPGWYGTLPSGRTTALRDDSTVKVRPGAVTAPPAASTPTPTTPAPAPTANTFGGYAYAYAAQQQQGYHSQTSSYTPYKPGQTTSSFYPNYTLPAGSHQQGYYTQQAYTAGATNQQPYGAATGQQPYGYSWYSQYPGVQSGAGSGRGTPQPIVPAPATSAVATTYGSFFGATATAAASGTTPASRTPAVANTVVATPSASGTTYGQSVPTLPVHLRTATTNGTGFQQQSYLQATR
ncbi:unnamed protein product [Cyclocybe aegerita]|uniref:Uncharacterized protein n=1 Tax=Cyclocybe aegerita TaxID=1973307 RepID=A0A8S0XLY8_CYCAE|nr:unnamed protein product [Cyclocybe aegerita]